VLLPCGVRGWWNRAGFIEAVLPLKWGKCARAAVLAWRGVEGGGFGRLAGVSQEFFTYRSDRRRLYWPSNSIVEGAVGDKWLMGMAGMRLGKWRGLA
jgi:hypothetical protein